jgi:5-methyltetrahydrofolate--homocysteine methyltransferase
MPRNQELFEAVGTGNRKAVEEIILRLLEEEIDVVEMLDESMIPAMRDVGERFSRSEVYVPELLIAARAMQTGMGIIEPLLAERGHVPIARVCIGTVKGDLHDIGKNLVAMMLKGAGYDVNDLGVDCGADAFKQAVDEGAQAVLSSALLTTTMPYMETIVDAFKDRPDIKVIIGGAPITAEFCERIGANAFGFDANDAVKILDPIFSGSVASPVQGG